MDGTVLVADDDRTIRTVLTQALTRAGCKVHATASLVTLMRWIAEGKGDLVISDVMMPDGNGLELLPAIRDLRPELPVIIISAQNTIMTAIQASEADAFDYLPKPFDLPDLMKRSARALGKRPGAAAGARVATRAGITHAVSEMERQGAEREAALTAEIDARITAAEQRIARARDEARTHIRDIAIEACEAASERVAGIKVKKAVVTAAVDGEMKRRNLQEVA